MQFYIDTLLLSLLLPLAAGAGFVLLASLIEGSDGGQHWDVMTPRWLSAHILLSVGPAVAFVAVLALLGWFTPRPKLTHEILPFLGFAAAAGALLANCCTPGRFLIPLEVGIGAAPFLLPNWAFALYVQERPFWLLFFPQAILFLWLTAAYIRGRPGDGGLVLGWLAWGGAAATLLFLSGNARFAQMAGVVTAVLSGGAALTWKERFRDYWHRMMPVCIVLLAALLLQGYLFSRTDWEEWSPHDIPRLSFLLVLLAPVTSWLGELPGVNRLPPRVRGLLQAFLMAAVAGLGIYTALSLPEPMTGEDWE